MNIQYHIVTRPRNHPLSHPYHRSIKDIKCRRKYLLPGLSKFPHVPPPVDASESVTSIVDKSYIVCGEETSGGHSCPRCFGNIHVICASPEGEEGYGGRKAGIQRNQERQQERMLNASSKKFKQAQVGHSVLIPISQPYKISSLCPRNILGCNFYTNRT